MKRYHAMCWVAWVSLCCGLLGCGGGGPKPVPVSGKVTFKGEPLKGAQISFHPEGGATDAIALGVSDDAGNFQLATVNDPGAFPGKYKVTVSKMEMPKVDAEDMQKKMMMGGLTAKSLLPSRYNDVAKTPFAVEVPKTGKQDVVLELNDK